LAHALRDHGAHEVFGLPGEHSRPVYLEVPRDLVNTPCAPVQRLPPTPWAPAAAAACAEDIMARLNSAERAVILVDVEVRRFGLEAQVAELAHRLGLPCATTFLGAGLMADHRDLMHGTYLGAAGDSAVTALIEDADVVLGLGLIPSDTNLGIATSSFDWRRVIDVAERRVSIGYCVYENVPLAAVVEGLLAVTKRTHNAPRATPRPIAPPIGPPAEPVAPVRPSDIIAAVESLRSHHPLPITVDVGDCLFAAVDLAPGPLIAAGYYAAMGMASPAALGIQASTGQRALALVGDGAFHMTGSELIGATRSGWDPIVIVFNNAEWTMLRTFAEASPIYSLPAVDFAALARSMGGDGYVVTRGDELAATLATAHATRGRFQLIDVRLAPGVVSARLDRFAGAFSRTRDTANATA